MNNYNNYNNFNNYNNSYNNNKSKVPVKRIIILVVCGIILLGAGVYWLIGHFEDMAIEIEEQQIDAAISDITDQGAITNADDTSAYEDGQGCVLKEVNNEVELTVKIPEHYSLISNQGSYIELSRSGDSREIVSYNAQLLKGNAEEMAQEYMDSYTTTEYYKDKVKHQETVKTELGDMIIITVEGDTESGDNPKNTYDSFVQVDGAVLLQHTRTQLSTRSEYNVEARNVHLRVANSGEIG